MHLNQKSATRYAWHEAFVVIPELDDDVVST
jgi:hypothetical protein